MHSVNDSTHCSHWTDPGPCQRPTTWPSTWITSWLRLHLRSPNGRLLEVWAGLKQWRLKPRTWCLWRTRLRSWMSTVSIFTVESARKKCSKLGCSSKVLQRHLSTVGWILLLTPSLNKGCLCLVLSLCLSVHSQAIETYFYFVASYPDVNMYLSNKLFRTSQLPLNLSDSTTQQDPKVDF